MADAVTIEEAAKELNVSSRTLRRYIKQGAPSIPGPRGKLVDVQAVVTWMRDTGAAEKGRKSADLVTARIAKTNTDTELARLRLRVMSGELIDVREVRAEETRRIAIVREGLLALCDTLPPKIEGLPQDDMRDVVQRETERLLGEYARGRGADRDDVG